MPKHWQYLDPYTKSETPTLVHNTTDCIRTDVPYPLHSLLHYSRHIRPFLMSAVKVVNVKKNVKVHKPFTPFTKNFFFVAVMSRRERERCERDLSDQNCSG